MWETLIVGPVKSVISQAGLFISALAGVVVILLIGWIIAKIVRNIIVRLLKVIDSLAETAGVNDVLAKGGIKYSPSGLVGAIFYWLILLATLSVAINTVGLTVAADLLNQVILYIPNVIAAIIVLILGGFAARFLTNVVQATTANIGLEQSRLLGKIVEVIVIVFVIVVALEQLRIGQYVIGPATLIILASLGLAIALAFGLGARDLAKDTLEDLIKKLKVKK